jgi:hypothetical protein
VERGERRLDLIEFIEFANALGAPAKTVFGRLLTALNKV